MGVLVAVKASAAICQHPVPGSCEGDSVQSLPAVPSSGPCPNTTYLPGTGVKVALHTEASRGAGYACYSCYVNFGAGKKAKAAADPKQTAITQFFKKQKQ